MTFPWLWTKLGLFQGLFQALWKKRNSMTFPGFPWPYEPCQLSKQITPELRLQKSKNVGMKGLTHVASHAVLVSHQNYKNKKANKNPTFLQNFALKILLIISSISAWTISWHPNLRYNSFENKPDSGVIRSKYQHTSWFLFVNNATSCHVLCSIMRGKPGIPSDVITANQSERGLYGISVTSFDWQHR